MKVATSQYAIGYFERFESFADKLEEWITSAGEADLVLFPEYGSMELTSLFGPKVYSDLQHQLQALQELLPRWIALHQELARRHNKVIAAASFPVKIDGGYVNRVHVFGPAGLAGYQDKCIMTRFENEQWFISPGAELHPIQTELGSLGVITCYDAEFPLLGHQLARAGCEILLAPSCTDTQAGFNRVAIGARARAMENQCYVMHSPTVGMADWSPAVDENIGRAGIYGPIDHGFPQDGILKQAIDDQPQWVSADLDLKALEQVRRDGQVLNRKDWSKQEHYLNEHPRSESKNH